MKKFIKAMYLDDFILCISVAIVDFFILHPLLGAYNRAIESIIIFTTVTGVWIFRPLMFKNATIGMKIFGLRIVDKDGNCPPPKMILYRQMNFVALAKECRALYLNNEDMDYLGLNTVGTHIIDVSK